jgi:outer membrane protein OmpA-like peptidoglycan-associated protein
MSFAVMGQTVIDTTKTADYLVKKILMGNGVLAGNVTFTGPKHSIGIYANQTAPVGIDTGIVLTSGNAIYTVGPNKSPRTGWASNAPGDKDLDAIARGKTHDASVLEFDFVTASENLSFRFVFASEEYLEYVGSKFNDVFGFFLTGPDGKKINLARLPDSKNPITVNTVNNRRNNKYFIDNTFYNTTDPFVWDVRQRKVVKNEHYMEEEVDPPYDIQYDGFTTVIEVNTPVIPNEKYHIKLAIADVADGILDSGVFLEGGSFRSSGNQIVRMDKFVEDIDISVPKDLEIIPVVKGEVIPVEEPKIVKIQMINFDFDKHNLNSDAVISVRNIYRAWQRVPKAIIEVAGHTDSFGSNAYNETLSKNRTASVADALKTLGVPEDKIRLVSYGEIKPLQQNSTSTGRAVNRRVVCTIIL